jgi:hypothetical protein
VQPEHRVRRQEDIELADAREPLPEREAPVRPLLALQVVQRPLDPPIQVGGPREPVGHGQLAESDQRDQLRGELLGALVRVVEQLPDRVAETDERARGELELERPDVVPDALGGSDRLVDRPLRVPVGRHRLELAGQPHLAGDLDGVAPASERDPEA